MDFCLVSEIKIILGMKKPATHLSFQEKSIDVLHMKFLPIDRKLRSAHELNI